MSRRNQRNAGEKPLRATERKFTFRMQKKLVVLFVFVLLAFLGLSIRLFMINRENGEVYKRQVLSQQSYDSKTLPYKRGDIIDANGSILATSEKVYNVILDVVALNEKKDYLNPTISALKSCFSIDENEVRSYITSHPNSRYKILVKQVSYEDRVAFETLQDDKENGGENIKGIWFEDQYRRTYPNGTLACDVIGFTLGDNMGSYGLEEYYDDVLNGMSGREYGYLNDDSNLERTVKPAVDGQTLVTTLDANVQAVAEKYLKEFSDAHLNEAREGLGANNLGAIVMEVDTGNILAMASYPNFDLNNPKDISAYYTEEQIAEMEEAGTLEDTYNALWRNFCISDTFEPGSTMKPFTVAGALDCGAITGGETYDCKGVLEVGGHKIHCHNRYGDGLLTVQQAVEQSCNVALMHIADAMGAKQFTKYQHAFNFGLKTNVDLAGEARTENLIYTADKMVPADLATNSFGQSFNATMIQMAAGFCSLVNGGYYYEPHMVSKILNADGSVAKSISPRVLKRTISSSVSDTIIQYCNGVVTNGTGKTARPAGYAIGGKTGTAQTLPRDNGEYIVSFMGYAPADNPKILVYVVVDRPNIAHQDDAKCATKIVRQIMTEVLPYEGIFMTEELSEQEQKELEELSANLTITYQQKLAEMSVSGNDPVVTTEENAGDTANPDAESGATGEEGQVTQKIWETFEKDPNTGNYIDPETGHQIDPDTGDDLDGVETGQPQGESTESPAE